MKRSSSLCVAMMLSLSGPALAGGLECAIEDALSSKSVFGTPVEAFNHRFTIKPVETSDIKKSSHTITGIILRHNKGAKEDQVAYRIVKEKGAIKEVFLQVNGGEWQSLSPAMTAALGDHAKGKPMSNDEQNAAAQAMYQVGRGSWQKAAECLVARIGVRHC